MGFGFDHQLSKITMSKNPFLLPPEFYKNLFAASAILQKPSQAQNECNKLFNAQNFPRNLLFSCGEDKEVNSLHTMDNHGIIFLEKIPICRFTADHFFSASSFIEINVVIFFSAQNIIGISLAGRTTKRSQQLQFDIKI